MREVVAKRTFQHDAREAPGDPHRVPDVGRIDAYGHIDKLHG